MAEFKPTDIGAVCNVPNGANEQTGRCKRSLLTGIVIVSFSVVSLAVFSAASVYHVNQKPALTSSRYPEIPMSPVPVNITDKGHDGKPLSCSEIIDGYIEEQMTGRIIKGGGAYAYEPQIPEPDELRVIKMKVPRCAPDIDSLIDF